MANPSGTLTANWNGTITQLPSILTIWDDGLQRLWLDWTEASWMVENAATGQLGAFTGHAREAAARAYQQFRRMGVQIQGAELFELTKELAGVR